MQIQAAQAVLTDQRDIDRAVELLGQARRMATDGLNETRRALHALRADTPPLAEALADLSADHQRHYGAQVSFEVTGAPRSLSADAGLALTRTAQEALVNTAKHAPHQPVAGAARLPRGSAPPSPWSTSCRPIAADGHPGLETVNGGYGLAGMRERLLLIDGSLSAGRDRRQLGRHRPGPPMTGHDGRRRCGSWSPTTRPASARASCCCSGSSPTSRSSAPPPTASEAIELVAQHQPDAILLDLHMPVLDGIETTRLLTEQHPDVAIVVLTTYADDVSVLAALGAGARSYLTKDADRADIANALRGAATGLSVLDPAVQATLRRRRHPPHPGRPIAAGRCPRMLPDGLTRREGEILSMMARGMSNPDIAAELYLSSHTVKSHINRIFAKTGSPDRAAAVRYALDQHLA